RKILVERPQHEERRRIEIAVDIDHQPVREQRLLQEAAQRVLKPSLDERYPGVVDLGSDSRRRERPLGMIGFPIFRQSFKTVEAIEAAVRMRVELAPVVD